MKHSSKHSTSSSNIFKVPIIQTINHHYVLPVIRTMCLKQSFSISLLYDIVHMLELGNEFYSDEYHETGRKFHTSRSYRRIEKIADRLLADRDSVEGKPFGKDKVYTPVILPELVGIYNSVHGLLESDRISLPFEGRSVNWSFVTKDPDFVTGDLTFPELLLYAAIYNTTRSRSLRKLNSHPVNKTDIARAQSWIEKVKIELFSTDFYVAIVHCIMTVFYHAIVNRYCQTNKKNFQKFWTDKKYRSRKDVDRLIKTLYKKGVLDRPFPKDLEKRMSDDPSLAMEFIRCNEIIWAGETLLNDTCFVAEMIATGNLSSTLDFGGKTEIDVCCHIDWSSVLDPSLKEKRPEPGQFTIFPKWKYECAVWIATVIKTMIQSAQNATVNLLRCLPEVIALEN